MDRRVITFDNAGVGGSSGATPNTVAQRANDAIAFLPAMGLEPIDILGFSIGSFVAQEVALTRPDLVRRVVLASSAPKGAFGMQGWAHDVMDAVGKRGTDPERYLPRVLHPDLKQRRGRARFASANVGQAARPGPGNDMGDSGGSIRRCLQVGHPRPVVSAEA